MKVFYHSCPREHKDSILKDGLLRSKSSLWKASGGAIYLTSKIHDDGWIYDGQDRVWLRIELPDSFIRNTEISGIDYYPKNWEYIVWKDVPAEFISNGLFF